MSKIKTVLSLQISTQRLTLDSIQPYEEISTRLETMNSQFIRIKTINKEYLLNKDTIKMVEPR